MIRWNEELDEALTELRGKGMPWRDIAEEMGFSTEAIREHAIKRGMSMRRLPKNWRVSHVAGR